ncbi:hypothetical protein B0H13DRAFT_2345907 [Mycena leptocephala]|nr:hypothetical protein B0H13DRAFT_2345907 [Mycena leptocephala]
MARARASPEPTNCWAEDSQIVGGDDTVMSGGSCRPFKNVVVCATGVLDKPALFKLAIELGATSVRAFTDRVTHLVAENHGGAKYFVMRAGTQNPYPAAILDRRKPPHLEHVHLSQIYFSAGASMCLEHGVHRLPIFSGVTLSGIPDIVLRTQINKALTAAGGSYAKALERPVRVTHLFCAGEAETDKMWYAEKFNSASEANPLIQLVWDEWFWDCLEHFDEAEYQARLPRPQRRSTETHPPHAHQHGARASAPTHSAVHVPSAFDDDAEDDEGDEFAPVQSVPGLTLQLWSSLLKGRGYEVARGGVVLSPGKAREMIVIRSLNEDPPAQDAGTSGLSSFRRANSIIVPREREGSAGPSRLPFGRSASTANAANSNSNNACPSSARAKRLGKKMSPPPTSTPTPAAIENAGGFIVRADADTDADYIIVRLVSGSALYFAEHNAAARERYRTECWLERCRFVDRVCAPDEHASFAKRRRTE